MKKDSRFAFSDFRCIHLSSCKGMTSFHPLPFFCRHFSEKKHPLPFCFYFSAVFHWLLLKWVKRCTKHFKRMVLTCPVFLSGKRKPESIISIYGKRTDCNCLLSEYLPDRWNLRRYVRIFITTISSRQGVWALSPDGFCRGSWFMNNTFHISGYKFECRLT